MSTSLLAAPPAIPVPDVNVVNTPSVSVTNTPNVNVTNTPNVSVTNTPNVNVTNTPNVAVANTPDVNVVSLPAIAIQPEIITPYGTTRSAVSAGSTASCFFDVPAGKALHIEKVSGFTGQGNVIYILVQPSRTGEYSLTEIPRLAHNAQTWVYVADISTYATDSNEWEIPGVPGSLKDFRVVVATDGTGPAGSLTNCTVNGKLIDAATVNLP